MSHFRDLVHIAYLPLVSSGRCDTKSVDGSFCLDAHPVVIVVQKGFKTRQRIDGS